MDNNEPKEVRSLFSVHECYLVVEYKLLHKLRHREQARIICYYTFNVNATLLWSVSNHTTYIAIKSIIAKKLYI